MAQQVMNDRLNREKIIANYVDTQHEPEPLLNPAMSNTSSVGVEPKKISYATTKAQSKTDYLVTLNAHEKENYSLTVSQEELVHPTIVSPVRNGVHNVSEITCTTNEVDEETTTGNY